MIRLPGRRRALLLAFLIPGPVLICCESPSPSVVRVVQDRGLPYIYSIAPGIAVPGQVVVLNGFGFGAAPGEIYVTDQKTKTIGPLAVVSWADDSIRVRIPATTPFDVEGFIKLRTSDSRELPVQPTIRILGPSP